MDRTFSSPSILGLPNSSSFTCWGRRGRASLCGTAPSRARAGATPGPRLPRHRTALGGAEDGKQKAGRPPGLEAGSPLPGQPHRGRLPAWEQSATDAGHSDRPLLCEPRAGPGGKARRPPRDQREGDRQRLSEGGLRGPQGPRGLPAFRLQGKRSRPQAGLAGGRPCCRLAGRDSLPGAVAVGCQRT